MNSNEPATAAGTIFESRYSLVAELGEGGYGTVYEAKQLATGQRVAIKVMRPSGRGDAASVEKRILRFQREMRLCALLYHPNIVRLIDSGRIDHEGIYSVFELVRGRSLADILRQEGALAPQEAKHLMLQVLDALSSAHAEGIVHRDLKPRNIMVIPGARRNAVVLDFGIGAFTSGTPGVEHDSLTATGETLGTPAYAAPEQLRGLEPTPRSDLYSWGLVFLECLTGKEVIAGASAAEIVFKQLDAEPVAIPRALEHHPLGDILRRATAKDIDARVMTARELLEDLESCDVSSLARIHVSEEDAASGAFSSIDKRTRSRPAEIPRDRRRGSGGYLVDHERRQLTVACSMLRLLPVNPGAIDAEELDALLWEQYAICSDIVRRHSGHVVSALGDQLLFYFGYPQAEEDSPGRAARAALAIIQETKALDGGSGARRSLRTELRIGLHTGLVTIREPWEGDARRLVGSTPRIASLLATTAEPWTISVSKSTQRLLRTTFKLDPTAKYHIDALAGAVESHRLLAEAREATPNEDAHKTRQLGRDQEMDLLVQRWSRVRSGAGQSSLITGEPGIGKSRLTRELQQKLRGEAHSWLECRCSPDARNYALYPVFDLLERVLELDSTNSHEEKAQRLDALLVRHGLSPAETAPLLAPRLSIQETNRHPPLAVSPQRQKELLLDTLVSLLMEMADERPVVFLVEDLHWADPTTIELLARIVREAPSTRLYALFTARPEFTPSFPTAGMLQLQLNRLERPHVEGMIQDLLGENVTPKGLLDRVVHRADGVPLFVEELTRMMLDFDRGAGEGAGSTPAPTAMEIPGTLRDLLTARLDRLGRAKETAQVAAALGREFDLDLLRAVNPLGDDATQEDLTMLIAAELVHKKRRQKSPAYQFKHALIRDAAYESMVKRSRQQVHARIAKTLQDRFPEIGAERPDLLALHHAAADQKEQAIGFASSAAMAALQRSAYAEAIAHGREAIGWLGAVEEERQRGETELGLNGIVTPALMAARGYGAPEVEAIVQRSQVLLDGLGDGPHTFTTLWALWGYHELRGDHAIALGQAQRSLALSERAEDLGQRVVALIQVGHSLFFYGRFEEARAHLEKALSLYDPRAHRSHTVLFSQDSKVFALGFLAMSLWFLGYPDQAVARATEGVRWAREVKHANSLGMALYYQTCVWQYRRDTEEIRAVTTTLLEVATEFGLQLWQVAGTIQRSAADRDAEVPMQIIAGFRSMGVGQVLPYFMSLVAEAEASHGKLDIAIERLDECLQIAEDKHEFFYVHELHRLKGTYLLERDGGATTAAEECFRRAIHVARQQNAKMPELRATLALSRLLISQGKRGELPTLMAIRQWFGEGLETRELKEARALALTESAPE